MKGFSRSLLRIWVTVALAMAATWFAAWEGAALIGSPVLFRLFEALFWIAPAVGLLWTGIVGYRVLMGNRGARSA